MNENKLKERVFAANHSPTIEELFEQGYELKCFCGKQIKSFEEFKKTLNKSNSESS